MARIILAQGPVTVGFEAFRAERDRLVEPDISTDDRSLADDDARPVIDEEAFADLGAGMNVDPGFRMGVFGDDARNHRDTKPIEPVREPVPDDRRNARKAEDDLVDAPRGRVSIESRSYVSIEQRPHAWKDGSEFLHDLGGALTAAALEPAAARLVSRLPLAFSRGEEVRT